MKAGVPIVAGSLAFAGVSTAIASASTHPSKARPSYTIVYQGPLTGGYAALGLNMTYAVQLAISQWNHKAGAPFTLKFEALNDQGEEANAITEARVAVGNSKVVAVVGPAFSGATKSAQGVYGPADMPLVSPSATNPALVNPVENAHHNFFRVVADDSVQGPADANYVVKKLKDKNVYVVNDGSDYGSGLASAFGTQAHKDGATVETNTADATSGCGGSGDTSEYPTLASEIASSGAKLVFYGGYYCDFSLLTAAVRTAGYHGKIMSGDGSDDPHYVSGTSPRSDANGTLLTCACAALGNSAADKAFAKGFEVFSHKVAPGTYSPESFDSANTIIQVMVTLVNDHKPITRANIVKGLRTVTYVGLTKVIHFLPDGNIKGDDIYVNEVENGKIVQLGLE
jgi:branched-chain amino acid transport system substrate-binding protein